MKYIVKYRKKFSLIAFGLLLGSIFQLILPFLTQWIVDIGIKNEDISFIWLILLGEFTLVTGRMLSDFMRRWFLLGISIKINISLVTDFFIKLLGLPMSFFDNKLMGDLLQRMGDHGRVQAFLTNEVLNIVFTILSFIVLGAVLFIYNYAIFLVFLGGSVMYAIWISLFLKRRKVLDYEVFEKEAIISNLNYRFVSSMQEVKLQNCQKRRLSEWEQAQEGLLSVKLKSLKLQQTQEAGSIFINELKNILVTVIAATAVISHDITLGAMLAVQYIIGQLNGPISQIMGFVYTIQDTKISLDRINEIHDEPEEELSSDLKTSYYCADEGIEFNNVTFRYDRHSSKNILNEITAKIEKGKITAIVGASGSGKSTMIKLMLGYYPVITGELKLGGEKLADYSMKWWRSKCGVVMQEGVIFSESIERNIAVEDGEIDRERMEKAAKIACVHDFVMALPLKYDTKIGPDGHGLSLGQRQRILIARAVYRNPDYIFLDEATNSLDANNERAIVENLTEFYKGKTVVIVAHRLSTVKNADKIIVLEKGEIAETGNHTTLIDKKGIYWTLVKNQLELGN